MDVHSGGGAGKTSKKRTGPSMLRQAQQPQDRGPSLPAVTEIAYRNVQ